MTYGAVVVQGEGICDQRCYSCSWCGAYVTNGAIVVHGEGRMCPLVLWSS